MQTVVCARKTAQQAFKPVARPPNKSTFFFVPKTPRKRPPRGVKLTNENSGFRRFPYAGVVPLVKKFTARAGMVAWSDQA